MAPSEIGDPVQPNISNMPEASPASFSFLNFIDPANDSKDRALYAGTLLKNRVYF